MTDRYQTQCPHCHVKFQITAQQLQLANGTVRCGSCLQVFQATQHLVPLGGGTPSAAGSARPAPAAPTAAPPARPATPPPPPARTAAPPPARPAAPAGKPADGSSDDLVERILRELEEPAAPPAAAKPAPAAAKPAAPKPAAAKPAAPAAPQWAPAAPPPPASGGGQWAMPPPTPPGQSVTERYGIEENKTRIGIGGGSVDPGLLSGDDPFGASEGKLLDDDQLGADSADESWAKKMLGEAPPDERDERVRKFQISADQLKLTDQTGARPAGGLAARLAAAEALAPTAEPRPASRPVSRTAAGAADDELDFLNLGDGDDGGMALHDVDLPGSDPADSFVDVAQTHEISIGKTLFWGVLSLLALLLLAAQYLYFNFDTLARQDSWRGFYGAVCGATGCALPGNSDLSRIEGANFVIRSHPTLANALVVDAIIYNRAPFGQPFPRLELGFSGNDGQLLAGRVFEPAEYLHGELEGAATMPVNTPVHLSLEIVDPGNVSGYTLRPLPPAPPAD